MQKQCTSIPFHIIEICVKQNLSQSPALQLACIYIMSSLCAYIVFTNVNTAGLLYITILKIASSGPFTGGFVH